LRGRGSVKGALVGGLVTFLAYLSDKHVTRMKLLFMLVLLFDKLAKSQSSMPLELIRSLTFQ
jgi:hypothetical protein